MTCLTKYVFQTKDLNLSMLNMITGMNVSKTLKKHISCECKYNLTKENVIQINGGDNDKCPCECKNHNVCEKDYIWNPSTCNCENGNFSKYYR